MAQCYEAVQPRAGEHAGGRLRPRDPDVVTGDPSRTWPPRCSGHGVDLFGIDSAQLLAMIDLDASLYVEYDDNSKEPLALIETAQDVGQAHKSATVTTNLAN